MLKLNTKPKSFVSALSCPAYSTVSTHSAYCNGCQPWKQLDRPFWLIEQPFFPFWSPVIICKFKHSTGLGASYEHIIFWHTTSQKPLSDYHFQFILAMLQNRFRGHMFCFFVRHFDLRFEYSRDLLGHHRTCATSSYDYIPKCLCSCCLCSVVNVSVLNAYVILCTVVCYIYFVMYECV